MARKKSSPKPPEHCDHIEDCKAPDCECEPKKSAPAHKAGTLLERRKARQAEKLASGFVSEAPFVNIEG